MAAGTHEKLKNFCACNCWEKQKSVRAEPSVAWLQDGHSYPSWEWQFLAWSDAESQLWLNCCCCCCLWFPRPYRSAAG